jgi:hypothetical protein
MLPLTTCSRYHSIARGEQPKRDPFTRPTATMARRVFLGDCKWCTRNKHSCIRRVSAERGAVSDTLLDNLPKDEFRA